VNLFALDIEHGCTEHIFRCAFIATAWHVLTYTVEIAVEVLSQAIGVTSEEIQGSLWNDSAFTPVVV
jgi:hypothetical protein